MCIKVDSLSLASLLVQFVADMEQCCVFVGIVMQMTVSYTISRKCQ